MLEPLRRLYNTVDRFFDRRALTQELHFSCDLKESNQVTARHAFQVALQAAQQLDRGACLKLIAGHAVNHDGTSSRWEFFFDLPARRAKLACDWALTWDAAADDFGPARLEIMARPFPPAASVYHQMINEGKLLHRHLIGLWTQEHRRRPNLPLKFKDSDEVMAEFIRQGLDPSDSEFSFGTGKLPNGRPGWIALTRDEQEFYTDFE